MAYDPAVFNVDPYYDDYDDNKKFLRVLYKPGYAVQARELTQTQTILQNQVKRFGDHVFKDGSIVSESQVTTVKGRFLRVGGLTGYSGISINDFDGLTGVVSGKNTIKITGILPSLSGSNKDTSSIFFFGEYLAGPTGFSAGDIITSTFNGTVISATITGGTAAYNDYSNAPNSLPYAGDAVLLGVDSGVRYIKGYFVNHDAQKTIIYNLTGSSPNDYRKFNNLYSTVRFDVTDTIVTATDDDSLNDPAYGSYNYAAPGADRYRLDLSLAQDYSGSGVTAEYIIAKFENDLVSYRSNYPEYNVLADELARRTYDESGNYTINDFQIFVEDVTADESSLKINIGPGKAYIFGYEFVNPIPRSLTASKAREYETKDSLVVTPIIIGNAIDITGNSGATSAPFHLVDWNSSPLFYLSTGETGPFVNAGTARVGKYEIVESNKKVHLYDVKINSGYESSSIKRLFYPGYTAADQQAFNFEDGYLNVLNPNYSTLVYPLSDDVTSYAVRKVVAHEYTIQRTKVINTGAGSGSVYLADFAAGTEFTGAPNCEFRSSNDLKLISITGSAISISTTAVSNTQINYSGAPAGITAIAFVAINVNESSNDAYVRSKTSVTETTNVVMRYNAFEGFAYIGGKTDVYQIISITGNTGGSAFNMIDYFSLDTGHKDDIYDWSRLVLKSQYYSSGVTGVSVTYNRYSRGNSCLPYMVRSYGTPASLGLDAGGTGAGYKSIPTHFFRNQRGSAASLASCLDARPDRIAPSPFTGATENHYDYGATGGCHLIAPSFESQWVYYIPRTDKLVLTRDKQFKMLTGDYDLRAIEPPDSEDAMTLATISYLPYTRDYISTNILLSKNRRYTMRDIGKIDKRVDRLEYYTTLNLLEKEAKSLEIQDENGLNKFKNGIFVDSFTSRDAADLNNRDHKCSIDRVKQETRPRFIIKYADLSLTGSIASGLTFAQNGMALCNYTTDVFLRQPKASRFVNVNPYNVVNFLGRISLTPSSDDWIDVETRPDLVVNIDNTGMDIADGEEFDIGTVWDNWEYNWTGSEELSFTDTLLSKVVDNNAPRNERVVRTWERTAQIQKTGTRSRTGIRNVLVPETSTVQLGKRVVDVSTIPYMRALNIQFKGDGFRPNVRVYPFFDSTSITNFVSVDGATGASIITDENGRLGYNKNLIFSVPAGVYRTGDRAFRLIDDPSNIIGNSTTNGEVIFGSSGLKRVEEGTTLSVRSLGLRRESVNETEDTTTVETQVYTYITRAHDPVAQTFFVDPVANPAGIFVKKVDLYFKSKSPNIPVRFEMRPTVNGYPASNAAISFSEVNLLPSQVNISDDASTATTVEFENPIYIQPGECSMVLLSNSNEYEVWVSEMGQNDTISGERITSQPSLGSFFKSQNASTWTPEQMMDLKFTMHKCVFDTSGGVLTFKYDEDDFDTQSSGMANGANLWHFNTTTITPARTSISYTTEFESDPGTEYPTQNRTNLQFPIKKSIANASEGMITVRATLATENADVSPAIDLDRISGLYVQNVLNSFVGATATAQETYEKLPSVAGITATECSAFRYVSRKVNLQDGFESSDVDVYLSARLPQNSSIKVYMRSQAPFDSTPFRDLPYESMSVHPDYTNKLNASSQYVSVGEDDYVDLRFIRGVTGTIGPRATSGVSGQSEFKSFQVKVVMYGDSTNSVTPAFKEFKVIAT